MSGSSSERGTAGAPPLLLAALLLVASCTPPFKRYDVVDASLDCAEANRLAYRTVEAMRFTVVELQPAAAGRPGLIRARRPTAPARDAVERVSVRIDCAPAGVTVSGSEDGAWLEQSDFRRAFHHAFIGVRSARSAEAALEAQIRAGTAPPAQQRGDLRVVVRPLPGEASKLEFPFDLAAAGILPVHLDVDNLSRRGYSLSTDAIRLRTADRTRVAALTAAEAAGRVAAVPAGAAWSPQAIGDRLAAHAFSAAEIPPGARRQGYLYFPLAGYVGARLVFTDTETGEEEGVRVEF